MSNIGGESWWDKTKKGLTAAGDWLSDNFSFDISLDYTGTGNYQQPQTAIAGVSPQTLNLVLLALAGVIVYKAATN